MENPNKGKGRGAGISPDNRFHTIRPEPFDDGWGGEDESPEPLKTSLSVDSSRSVITYNQSPDVGFDRSINPYRGCEHGCVYCFARPTHAYLDFSPGLDFETRLLYKPEAPSLLRKELSRPRYRPAPIAVGINTDAYQPVERELGLTRRILEVLTETGHPYCIITKSSLVERDMDLLKDAALSSRVRVMVSVTTLDRSLARRLEPRAAAPERRLETIRILSGEGISVGVMVAPVIPVLTENELEAIMGKAREAGALEAGYILLRLPYETKDLFKDWLETHEPLKAAHVMGRVREYREGRESDSRFGSRMTGTGVFAGILKKRFSLARKRLGFPGFRGLDSSGFRSPGEGAQPALF